MKFITLAEKFNNYSNSFKSFAGFIKNKHRNDDEMWNETGICFQIVTLEGQEFAICKKNEVEFKGILDITGGDFYEEYSKEFFEGESLDNYLEVKSNQ